jgi:isopenicillin-N N-acyltransferase-like protein
MAGLGRVPRVLADEKPVKPEFALTSISGKPRERGQQYGARYQADIRAMIDREIFNRLIKPGRHTRDDLLRYAAACVREVKLFAPLIHDEMEGMAEGSGIGLEELMLLNLHEEVTRGGQLPKADHCTAIAVGPRPGEKGDTFVGQTWDWMESVRGLSNLLLWKRPEGTNVLAYAYPGLWVGAGLNSAGVALAWTSAGSGNPRIGIPSYVLIAHMLYQDSLKGALDEARRAKHAGFFTFVLGDGEGNLANVEGSPQDLVIEMTRGSMTRVGYGSRKMTNTPEGKTPPQHARCEVIHRMFDARKGPLDRAAMEAAFAEKIVGAACLDVMIFNTTKKEAILSRGPAHEPKWQRFTI